MDQRGAFGDFQELLNIPGVLETSGKELEQDQVPRCPGSRRSAGEGSSDQLGNAVRGSPAGLAAALELPDRRLAV
jgi:hypothetical protein